MAADFPASLPTLTTPGTATESSLSPDHPAVHLELQEELQAVLAKLGIDSSAVATSIDYLLKSASSNNPGHTHSGAALTGILEANITDGALLVRVGDAAGGDLGGTYPNPTVTDDSHAHTGSTITLADDSVTDAKLRNSTAVSVIGRSANSSGDPADIAAGSNGQYLTRQGNALSFANVLEADITDGSILARVAGTETISGTWTHNAGSLRDKGSIIVSLKAFGCAGDDSTDDLANFNLAVAAANATGSSARIFVDPGRTGIYGIYRLSAAPTTLGGGVELFGTGYNVSIIKTTFMGDLFTLSNGYNSVHGVGFQSSTSTGRTSGAYIKLSGAESHVYDCNFANGYTGIELASSKLVVSDCHFSTDSNYSATADSSFIYVSSSSVLVSQLRSIYGQGIVSHCPTYGVRITACGDLTCDGVLMSGCTTNWGLVPGNGETVTTVRAVNCQGDQGAYGLYAKPAHSGGAITACLFTNFYAASATTHNIYLAGNTSANCTNVEFVSTESYGSTGHGLFVDTLVSDVRVNGGVFAQNVDGVRVAANVNHVAVTGAKSGAAGVWTANTGYGVNSLAGTGNYQTIVNNDLQGNTTGAFFKGATGANNNFYPNIGDGYGLTCAIIDNQKSAAGSLVSSAAEQTIYTFTVPANTLGLNGKLRLVADGIYLNNSGGNETFTIRVKFGGTTYWGDVSPNIATDADNRPWQLTVELFNVASASSQRIHGSFRLGSGTDGSVAGLGSLSVADAIPLMSWRGKLAMTADTTSAQDLVVTWQNTTSNANIGPALRAAELELIR